MRRSTLCLRLSLSSYSVMLNLEIFYISQIIYPSVNGWDAKFTPVYCLMRPSFNLLDSLLMEVCIFSKATFSISNNAACDGQPLAKPFASKTETQ